MKRSWDLPALALFRDSKKAFGVTEAGRQAGCRPEKNSTLITVLEMELIIIPWFLVWDAPLHGLSWMLWECPKVIDVRCHQMQ